MRMGPLGYSIPFRRWDARLPCPNGLREKLVGLAVLAVRRVLDVEQSAGLLRRRRDGAPQECAVQSRLFVNAQVDGLYVGREVLCCLDARICSDRWAALVCGTVPLHADGRSAGEMLTTAETLNSECATRTEWNCLLGSSAPQRARNSSGVESLR